MQYFGNNIPLSDVVNATAEYLPGGMVSGYDNFITTDNNTFKVGVGADNFKVKSADSTTTGPALSITAPRNAEIIIFYAPSDYKSTDLVYVNGAQYPLTNLQGSTFPVGWSTGAPVTLYKVSDQLWYPFGRKEADTD